MEASGAGIGRLDYEDMFKEITSKLYGEDPDHRTSSVQNEFETSVSYKNDEDTGNGTDGSDDGGTWTLDDEPLKGTEGSRIAAYRAATATWRCYECGDCMGGGPRDVAEHFMELHSSRLLSEDISRNRLLTGRKDYLSPHDARKEELVSYLKNVRDQAERAVAPSRRTQETRTMPATLLPVPPTFLLQELPSTPPQILHQNAGASMPPSTTSSSIAASTGNASGSSSSSNSTAAAAASSSSSSGGSGNGNGGGGNNGSVGNNPSGKRYTCLYCPYGTDRRDLYTRHENIHREEKPFHCYVCYKPFSRADHVKKHFLRMHREHTYELSRIRRPVGSISATPKPLPAATASIQPPEPSSNSTTSTNTASINNNNSNPYSINIFGNLKPPPTPIVATTTAAAATTYQLQPPATNSVHTASAALYQAASLSSVVAAAAAVANASNIMHQQQPEANCSAATAPLAAVQTPPTRRLQNGSCSTGKSSTKSSSSSSSKANQEKRYTCCYCSWSGVDNWCLKRHLNTHLKPFACALCEYKAARAERLATHVLKVHNRRQCSRCSYLAEDLAQLHVHQLHVHRVSNSSVAAAAAAAATAQQQSPQAQQQNSTDRQQPQQSQPIQNRSEVASMPGIACWEQETSSCEENFYRSSLDERFNGSSDERLNASSCDERHSTSAERRSRKQRQPRRIMTQINRTETTTLDTSKNDEPEVKEPKSSQSHRKIQLAKFRCFSCPKNASARAYKRRPYHTRVSLLLHKLWRHKRVAKRAAAGMEANRAPAEITLKATVYTGCAL